MGNYVAFLDIPGFKDMINNNTHEEMHQILRNFSIFVSMKNLSLITLFVLFFASSIKSQVSNDKALQTFLNDKAFGKAVVPGFYKYCDTIHIIDTVHQFSNKPLIKFSKVVLVESVYSKKPPLKKWYCNNLIVTIKREKKQYVKLFYFHEQSNSAGFVKYKMIKGRLKKVKYEYGQY